jgi:hypothetical protein
MRGRWFVEQVQEETMRSNNGSGAFSNVVDCPALTDVVFKTGSANLSHPGNSVFHEMLRSQSDDGLQISPESICMILEDVMTKDIQQPLLCQKIVQSKTIQTKQFKQYISI